MRDSKGNISEVVQSIPTSWHSWQVMYATQSVTLTKSLTRTLTKPYEKRFLDTKWEMPIQRGLNHIMQLNWACTSNDSPFSGTEKGRPHRKFAMRTDRLTSSEVRHNPKTNLNFFKSCLSVVNSRNYADIYLRRMNYGRSSPPPGDSGIVLQLSCPSINVNNSYPGLGLDMGDE